MLAFCIARIVSDLSELGRTTLIATHKTALIPFVDRVLVCSQGRIVMDGPREEVLAQLRNNRAGRVSAVKDSGASASGTTGEEPKS
mgnify:FL=1